MTRVPRFIRGKYPLYFSIDLNQLDIDTKNVKEWKITFHILHIKDFNDCWRSYDLEALTLENVKWNTPFDLSLLADNLDEAEFPKPPEKTTVEKSQHETHGKFTLSS